MSTQLERSRDISKGHPRPDYPLIFHPLARERVWGGSRLRELFGKPFSAERPIGESWEVADRPDATSVVRNGPLAGVSLRELMIRDPVAVAGASLREDQRFPWLAKLLDAREDLSLQVHPPARLAKSRGGEAKTEVWYVAAAEPGARVLAGIRPGIGAEEFAARSADGSVARCFNEIPVLPGDVLFVPSGRVHALGGGIVAFELQQNSDTTYRVFDFNRLGLDGRPRALHLADAMQAIDFNDFHPRLVPGRMASCQPGACRLLVSDAAFEVVENHAGRGDRAMDRRPAGTPGLVAVVRGQLTLSGGGESVAVSAGGFALLPACLGPVDMRADADVVLLQMTVGRT